MILATVIGYLAMGAVIAFLSYALGYVAAPVAMPAWQAVPLTLIACGLLAALWLPLLGLLILIRLKDARFD